MKIIDLLISRKYLDSNLRDGTFYIRFEQIDVFYELKLKQKFSMDFFKQFLDEKIESFSNVVRLVSASLEEVAGKGSFQLEEAPSAWTNDNSIFCFVWRGVISGVNGVDDLLEKLNVLKPILMKDHEVHIRIKNTVRQ